MRLHKPVHPHHQPHLAHSFAKTDTHAGSGAGGGHGFAHSGDEHAASGAGFHQGGIPESYDEGGMVANPAGDYSNVRLDRWGRVMTSDGPVPMSSVPAQHDVRGNTMRGGYIMGAGTPGGSPDIDAGPGSGTPDGEGPGPRASKDDAPPLDRWGRKITSSGPVNVTATGHDTYGNPVGDGYIMGAGTPGGSSDITLGPGAGVAVGGPSVGAAAAPAAPGGYAEGGVVDPKSFLGWPNETPGFEDGGQVDPQEFLNPTPDTSNNLQTLADHANQVYTDYHKQLEQQWNTEQSGGADVSQNSNDNDADDQGYARGGRVKKVNNDMGQEERMLAQDEAKFTQMDNAEERALAEDERKQNYAEGGEVDGGIPPGPAGAGVTPQSPAGNPGRPNYIDPNAAAPAEKNYAQNVSARQFTSPSVGTAFEQPPPIGGQRGQEWYGKKGGAGIPMTPGGK